MIELGRDDGTDSGKDEEPDEPPGEPAADEVTVEEVGVTNDDRNFGHGHSSHHATPRAVDKGTTPLDAHGSKTREPVLQPRLGARKGHRDPAPPPGCSYNR